MPEFERDLFYKYLKKSKGYFEFGSGGSTYQATQIDNIKVIYSVESDLAWQNELKFKIDSQDDKLHYIYIDMKTEPSNLGYPGENSNLADWKKYSGAFNNLTNDQQKEIDFILIDGRFRAACALKCFENISQNTLICFDDFLNRPYYHIVLDFFDIIDQAGRMVILQKKNVTPPGIYLLKNYESIPH